MRGEQDERNQGGGGQRHRLGHPPHAPEDGRGGGQPPAGFGHAGGLLGVGGADDSADGVGRRPQGRRPTRNRPHVQRRGRDSNPRYARRTAVFKTATFGRSVTSPGRTSGRDRHRPYHPGRPAVTASPPVRAHRSPTARSYLMSRVRGVEDTNAQPTLRTRDPAAPLTRCPSPPRPTSATAPRTCRRTRAGAACWRAPAAGSSARRAAPRPGPARSPATPAGAP